MKRAAFALFAVACAILPAGSASPAPAASASAVAGPSPDRKPLEQESIPADESKSPTMEEWKGATEVRVQRELPSCVARRVREWLKIHCTLAAGGAALQAGQSKGVLTWVEPSPPGADPLTSMFAPHGAEVVFPMRKGDARYFEIFEFRQSYAEYDWFTAIRISEQWIDGDSAPIVSIVPGRD